MALVLVLGVLTHSQTKSLTASNANDQNRVEESLKGQLAYLLIFLLSYPQMLTSFLKHGRVVELRITLA